MKRIRTNFGTYDLRDGMWEKVVLSIKKYNSTCHVDNEDVLVMTQGTFVRLGDVGENYVYAELIVTKLLEDE